MHPRVLLGLEDLGAGVELLRDQVGKPDHADLLGCSQPELADIEGVDLIDVENRADLDGGDLEPNLASAEPGFPNADAYAVAWCPRDQIRAALERWPSLAGDLEDPDAYCKTIKARLREVRSETGRVPSVAPLEVDAVVQLAYKRCCG